jgi:hypothetical protein
MNKRQKQIEAAIMKLPDKMKPEELEALICSLISAYVGFDEVPDYLMYLHLRTKAIHDRLMDQAKEETKH